MTSRIFSYFSSPKPSLESATPESKRVSAAQATEKPPSALRRYSSIFPWSRTPQTPQTTPCTPPPAEPAGPAKVPKSEPPAKRRISDVSDVEEDDRPRKYVRPSVESDNEDEDGSDDNGDEMELSFQGSPPFEHPVDSVNRRLDVEINSQPLQPESEPESESESESEPEPEPEADDDEDEEVPDAPTSIASEAKAMHIKEEETDDDFDMQIPDAEELTALEESRVEEADEDEEEDEDDEDVPEDDEDDVRPEDEWEVDEAELAAYEENKKSIPGHERWTREEVRLHRLLSMRGLHPLMPATWSRDFLGVPVHPTLFAPIESKKPVVIHQKGSQFRATKALRSIFELQSRVAGLRQVGITNKISRTIEKELRRYVDWAMHDAGLDRYELMPNVAVRRFDTGRTRKRDLARAVQTYFRDWAARYRAYYASQARELAAAQGVDESALPRPPRLLYGFVIIQHAVMLLTVDSARVRARPRCFADFNMSAENQWLDSGLNVAIPVHLARERLLRMVAAHPCPPPRRVIDVDHDDD